MIKNNLIKIVAVLIIGFLILGNTETFVEAFTDPTVDPNAWKPNIVGDDDLGNKAGNILGIINTVGILCSVIVLAILGIKYMVGSVEEKADLKKSMIPYVIGVCLLVCATTLPNIIYKIVYNTGFFG